MINLEHLTEEERKIIMDVLQRDEQLRQAEQERVKKLKTELHELRKKSAVKVDDDSSGDSGKKVCARCREPLGTIFNSGEVCPRCQHKVCSNCKVVLPNSKKWLCTICNKQLQIRLESGDAFGPQIEGQTSTHGTELVKMSLAQSTKGLDSSIHANRRPQSPADSGFHGRGPNAPSPGETNMGAFEEDYPSDASYEQSIGPSVSQRGSVQGSRINHTHEDSALASNGSAEIMVERVNSRTGTPSSTRRGDPNLQDPKCNASESGAESVHGGYTIQNNSRDQLSPGNHINDVQYASNSRLKSETTITTETPTGLGNYRRDLGYDVSMENLSEELSIESKHELTSKIYSQTNLIHSNKQSPLYSHSEDGQKSSPAIGTQPQSSNLAPISANNSHAPVSLTNPHAGSPRFSRHVTNNKMYVSMGGLGVFNQPTSNSDEFDSHSSERICVEGSGVYDSRYHSISGNMDEKYSDLFGEESTRQSDTDTQSITSASTVAWDTIADSREKDKNFTVVEKDTRHCITTESSDSHKNRMQNSRLTKAMLQQHGGVSSSGYESASSMSVMSESHSTRMSPGGPAFEFGVKKIVVDEKTLKVLKESEYPVLQYSDSSSTARWSTEEYVLLETDGEQSDKMASKYHPDNENNNLSLPVREGQSKALTKKEIAVPDILYLQEQGRLLQDFEMKKSAPSDSKNYEQAVNVGEPQNSNNNHKPVAVHDFGSINSKYITPQEKVEDGSESSDCSSIDLSQLDFLNCSDSDSLSDYDSDNKGRKRLKFGKKLATFEKSPKGDGDNSVMEWGLSEDTDGLVPLVLPGISPRPQSTPSGEDSSSSLPSLLRRFIGSLRTPEQSSASAQSQSDEDDEDNPDILNLSSDSESSEDSCLDATLIADSSAEKEAARKSKLAYNKALMRSLLQDLSEDDRQQTSPGNRKVGPKSVESQSVRQGPRSLESGHSKQEDSKNASATKNSASPGALAESKPRRKKKRKSKSKLADAEASVGYASKKGLMKKSQTQYGVLSSTPDGKTQLYTFGKDRNNSASPVDLGRGRYSPLRDTGLAKDTAKPVDRPRTPSNRKSFLEPQIYRKQPLFNNGSPHYKGSQNESSSSSSSCEDDEDEEVEETPGQEKGRDEVDTSSQLFFHSRPSRPFSVTLNNSSDSELSVIMEEPEEDDSVFDQSYDSKL